MTPSGTEPDRATKEAARWVVALDDDPDDMEVRARFEAWLRASPANAEAWANTADIYDMMGKVKPAYSAHWMPYAAERNADSSTAAVPARSGNRAWSAGENARRGRLRPISRRRVFIGAAALGVAACIALLIAPTVVLRLEADQVTATAELRSVSLEDGSTVRMGPDSAISIAFANGDRRVRLLKGEAFFEVAHDPDHPFRVTAGAMETTVLGTGFDVRLEDKGASVAVQHGRVRVDYPAARPPVSERLDAGEWINVTWAGAAEQGTTPPNEVASWLRGQLVARDRPLSDVVDDLRRYYSGLIVLTDAGLGRQRVSGVYNVANPAAALRAMAATHGGKVRQVSPWVLVISSG
jgi:transmembrane sensor